MDGSPISKRFASLVDDRVEDGMFRVDRSIYTDEAVAEAEFANIFERGWVFLCHDSQVPKHGDYFATEIGRQPVFVSRQKDGSLACFINACAHPVVNEKIRCMALSLNLWCSVILQASP